MDCVQFVVVVDSGLAAISNCAKYIYSELEKAARLGEETRSYNMGLMVLSSVVLLN